MGCPLDITSTYRRGAADAPHAIRVASDSIETYSPLIDDDLADAVFSDAGDIAMDPDSLEEALDRIESRVSDVLAQGGLPFLIGGEHNDHAPRSESFQEDSQRFLRHPSGRALGPEGRLRGEQGQPRDGDQTHRGHPRTATPHTTRDTGWYARGVYVDEVERDSDPVGGPVRQSSFRESSADCPSI